MLLSTRKAYDYEKTLAFWFNLSFSTGKPETQAVKHKILQKYFKQGLIITQIVAHGPQVRSGQMHWVFIEYWYYVYYSLRSKI